MYGQNDSEDADAIIVLGGDGQMLHSMREAIRVNKPIFGMNCGRIGFLMNDYASTDLDDRVSAAIEAHLHPLSLIATDCDGVRHEALAINEVSLLRQTHNAAHSSIFVNDIEQMEMLVCDGVMIATPAGSTAYNLVSAWPYPADRCRPPSPNTNLSLQALGDGAAPYYQLIVRCVSKFVTRTSAHNQLQPDNIEFRNITTVTITQASDITITLLHDKARSLSDRIISEQFQP
jgi:NAD+ kinase